MSASKQPPMLFRGGISGRVFIATRYRVQADGITYIDEKHDVTDQFERLVQEMQEEQAEAKP